MTPTLTPEREAELCEWAHEFMGWTRPVPCDEKPGWFVSVNSISGERHEIKPAARLRKDFLENWPNGYWRVRAFTRSLDAARIVVLAVKEMGLEPYLKFIDALKLSPGLIERAVSGGMERGDPDSVGVNLACGIVIGLESDPLEIILAAYRAVTGTEFQFDAAASGEEPRNAQGYTESGWNSLQRDMARLNPGKREDRPFVPIHAQRAAERAGIKGPKVVACWRGDIGGIPSWRIEEEGGERRELARVWEKEDAEAIAAALNAPAATPTNSDVVDLLDLLSTIAEKCGAPGNRHAIGGPITLKEQMAYVVGLVDRLNESNAALQEALDQATPEAAARFAASETHHEEHHQRERELEARIAELENAPAAAPVAGLFEGGISWAFEVIGRGGFARNEEFADGRAMGMNPPHEMAYLYRDGIPFEPINIDLYDARCTTWVECDRHGKPLPVPAPPAGGEGG